KDIWAYLLTRAVKDKNEAQIKEIVENFDVALEKITIADFSENENLRTSISKFLSFLKTQEKQNFDKCAKVLIRAISNSKTYSGKDKIKQLAFLTDSLTAQEITEILCEEVASQDAFNVRSIELFSSLLDRSQNESVASAISQRIKQGSKYNTVTIKKTKELLDSLEESSVKMIYHYALGALLSDMGLAGSLSFDAEQMKNNYRTMLLNLFAEEKITSGLLQISESIYPELEKVLGETDREFVYSFFKLLEKKISRGNGARNVLEEIKAKADKKLEEALLLQKVDFDSVIGFISASAFDKNFYLNKIFIEKEVSYNILGLYFHFFPRDTGEFYREIRLNSSDINFIRKIIENLKDKNTKVACDILENIFYTTSSFLKMEILNIMQGFSSVNENFIIAILLGEALSVKRQAMGVVLKNKALRDKAANALLSIPNSFGVKNKLLNENINMVGEFRLAEARPLLEKLAKLKVFWKKSLKDAAKKALDRLT
ncbi:MAG: hypothetical protein PHP17_04590, partial [Candidatus Omnitrophica bacterium]|nr:hypothetical protein [Candidatus Omnitrophota bacterium]